MPSESPKQAKVMSAIAHGWKPTGEAANIPVKVAKEFHAADKGKKYGPDRSSHHKGNPGFPSSVSHSPPKEGDMKSKGTEAKHEAREKEVMGAGYAEHHRGEKGKGHDTPQSMQHPKGFDHKQLSGCFLAEHHKAVDHSRTPHVFSGTHKSGPVLRVSGKSGAHQIGKK